MMHIETDNLVLYLKEDRRSRYSVEIAASGAATLADLLDAMERLGSMPEVTLSRLRGDKDEGSCGECSGRCCTDSLILIDGPALIRLEEFGFRVLDDRFAGLGIPALPSFPCIFLEKGRCAEYKFRPLVCRLFYCIHFSEVLEAVIYQSVGRLVGQASAILRQRRGPAPDADMADDELHRLLGSFRQSNSYINDLTSFVYDYCFDQGQAQPWIPDAAGYGIPLPRLVSEQVAGKSFRY